MEKKSYMDSSQCVVEMRDITKRFGNFVANKDINLQLHRGEVQAILGENGAGKSTLMNILYGLLKPTEGEIFVNGQPVTLDGPRTAIDLGIGMVHQHFMLVPPFTVTDNIILGDEPTRAGIVRRSEARKKVIELSQQYRLQIDPDAKVENISVGMQQRVEILKVLFRGADILIFDEPTASLTPQEIVELGDIIQNLVREGKSVLIITHKLKEIMSMADTCMIIRRGEYINKFSIADVAEETLASEMVGRNVSFKSEKQKQETGETVLDIKNLYVQDYRHINVVDDLNLEVKRGEIFGIAGIDGNGQTELVEALTGLRKASSGTVTVLGQDIYNDSARKVFDAGVSSIPEDRQKFGLVLDFNVESNLIIQNYIDRPYSSVGWLHSNIIDEHANQLIQQFDIRPADCAKKAARTLSGGNQQKVIIAREITNNKDLLICVNPTRGLDVGAIEYVHRYIIEARNQYKAVLLVSFEMDEILNLSDRIGVIYDGKIRNILDAEGVKEEYLGLLMAGGGTEHDK